MSNTEEDPIIIGTTNYESFLNKRIFILLRDGRKLYTILRSYDQFGNLILEDTIERYYIDLEWAEVSYNQENDLDMIANINTNNRHQTGDNDQYFYHIIRGENVVLIGEIDKEEFKTVNRRMAKFKRDIHEGDFMERYEEHRIKEQEERNKSIRNNNTDLIERDYY